MVYYKNKKDNDSLYNKEIVVSMRNLRYTPYIVIVHFKLSAEKIRII